MKLLSPPKPESIIKSMSDDSPIGWGMTRISYKRIFWHLYWLTEQEPHSNGQKVYFLKTRSYLKWDPKLTIKLKEWKPINQNAKTR